MDHEQPQAATQAPEHDRFHDWSTDHWHRVSQGRYWATDKDPIWEPRSDLHQHVPQSGAVVWRDEI